VQSSQEGESRCELAKASLRLLTNILHLDSWPSSLQEGAQDRRKGSQSVC